MAQSVARILGRDEVASSNLASSSRVLCFQATLAQSVARILGKDEVGGSSPLGSSRNWRE